MSIRLAVCRPLVVVVHDGEHKEAVDDVLLLDQDKLGLLEGGRRSALLVLRLGKDFLVVDGDGDVRVGRATAQLDALETASGPNGDLNDARSGVEGRARKELFEVDGEPGARQRRVSTRCWEPVLARRTHMLG